MEPAMLDLIEQPDLFHQAARIITENAIMFAKAQIEAGADMIGVGDAAASLIGPEMYVEHVLPWQKQLFSGIHEAGATVRLHICGDIRHLTRHMATSGAEIIDVDWMVPLAEAREAVGPEITLCGNFDPVRVLLRGTKEDVAAAARQCIADAGRHFMLMPGCEIPAGTAEENIRAFCPCEGSLVLDALRLP
jgi:MtaA/CmuA family methyltransferase